MSENLSCNVLEQLKNIWSDVLGIDIPDNHENFFSLGGNSIQALQIINIIHIDFKIEISVQDFFEALTLFNLATIISQRINQCLV